MADEDYLKYIRLNQNIDELNYFNPYRVGDPYSEALVKGFPIIFVTTPVLNLSKKNISNSQFFKYMSQYNHGLFKMLNFNGFGSSGSEDQSIPWHTTQPFIPLLTNKFISIDIKDTQAASKEFGTTFYGYKMELPGPIVDSINGGQFSISFLETRDAAITKIFKIWTDYIEGVTRGKYHPSQEAKTQKILDYTCSVYYFLLDMDGETIQYYCKYTGCTPTNVPYSQFAQESSGGHDIVNLGIDFNYSLKEDMDPQILTDFNAVMFNSPELLTGGTADKTGILTSTAKMAGSTNYKYNNWTENIDMNTLDKAAVYLESYSDNKDKHRYKLKFWDDNGSSVASAGGGVTGAGKGETKSGSTTPDTHKPNSNAIPGSIVEKQRKAGLGANKSTNIGNHPLTKEEARQKISGIKKNALKATALAALGPAAITAYGTQKLASTLLNNMKKNR